MKCETIRVVSFEPNIILKDRKMDRTIEFIIEPGQENMTVLNFLRQKGLSRSILVRMKEFPGAILQNGHRAYGKAILRQGDLLTVHIPETELSEKIVPVKMDLDICYEDEDLLLVNKAAAMPVHPSVGHYENTLSNGIMYYYQQKGQPFVFRCINRLDRDTTGLLILAKNPYSAAILNQQMVHRQIHRTYLAVVSGRLPQSGTIRAPIRRCPGSTIEREVDYENGEEAVTHFRCLAFRDGYSLAQLCLETGRTHQIRVHMKHIGHPLPGDFLYHPDYRCFSRQPLHSWKLDFKHPCTGVPMHFTAPVPEDIFIRFPDADPDGL